MSDQSSVAPEPALLSIADAARILAVSERHLYAMAARGALPTVRLGGRLLVAKSLVDNIVAAAVSRGLVPSAGGGV